MRADSLLRRIKTVIFLALVAFAALPVVARADSAQANVNIGLGFFQQPSTGLISQLGFLLNFHVEPREWWLRPSFGGLIEASFGQNRLIDGHVLLGGELVASKANYFKPFIGAFGDFGWANFTDATATYNGLVYGFMISVGTEIRFTDKDHAFGLRVTSAYRFLLGTIGGGLSGGDLNAIMLMLGVTF